MVGRLGKFKGVVKIIIKTINGIDPNSRDECPAALVTLELKIGLAGYDSAGSARMGIALWWAKNGIPYRVNEGPQGGEQVRSEELKGTKQLRRPSGVPALQWQ